MTRREVITLLGSLAAGWPLAASAQQPTMRRVGVLVGWDENNPTAKLLLSMLTQQLRELGWEQGSNIRLDVRFGAGNVDRMRVFAKELVGLGPAALVASTAPAVVALQSETRTVPIVFVTVADPVGAAFVESLNHPGANITGFINLEATMGGKWLELLKEVAPDIKRAAIMFNPDTAPARGSFFFRSFEAAARSLQIAPMIAPIHNETEIEATIRVLEEEPRGGLVVESDGFMLAHQAKVISLMSQHKVPAISDRTLPTEKGGLISYGPSGNEMFVGAARYVDRLLKGANPAELPVQEPTRFDLRLNLKTAEMLGLTIPSSVISRADEVIE